MAKKENEEEGIRINKLNMEAQEVVDYIIANKRAKGVYEIEEEE